MSRLVRACAALLLAQASVCAAQPLADDEAVVVTATRTDLRMREAIPHTTVLTAREIRTSAAPDLLSLLRREAGFEFAQNGGIGTVAGTFLRAAATNQVLVLVDGVRVSSLTTGQTQVEQLMLDQVERVEIVRGNVSGLYGSGAIGGVIQVFTRRGRGAPRASVDVGIGAEDSARLRADFSGETGSTRFSVNASALRTGGFSAIRPAIGPTVNPDRDGYRNRSLSASLEHRFAPGHEAGVRFFSSEGRVEFDNPFALSANDVHRGETAVGSVLFYAHNRLAAPWLSKLSLSEGRDRFDNFTNAVAVSRTRTRNAQLAWQNDFVLADDHTLSLGFEHLEQRVSSTTAYGRTAREVDALFAGYQGRWGAHALQLALRSEDYSDFGRARTHFAGYGYDLSREWRLVASASRAFRAPTFNELFFPGFGNPNLRPERSRAVEAGVQYASGAQLVRAVAFRTRIADLIGGFPIGNINQAELEGVEVSWRGALAGFDVRASLTVQDPVERAGGVERPLVRRAKNYGSFAVSREFGPWRLGGELLASGARPDNHITAFPAQRVVLRRYEVVNLVAAYRVGAQTELLARLDNAMDRRYELAHGYDTQRRKASLLLKHAF
jgi:vitamin B12 transporter